MELQGQKVIYIDKQTIITPAAKDAAKLYGIEFTTKKESCKENLSNPQMKNDNEIDSEIIYKALKILMDKGLLSGLAEQLSSPPYIAEQDKEGLKVVRGNTVRFDKFHTGNPNEKVYFQELMKNQDSSMNAGFFTIEKLKLKREVSHEEMNYVIEGTLTIEINGKTYTAYPGDVVYVPARSKVIWSSPDYVKLFYTTLR